MRWRVLVGALLGWCLPIPLALLIGSLMQTGLRAPGSAGAQLIPVLESEQRMRRMTYRQPCQRSADCEAPLGCLEDARYRSPYCTDSQCLTDAQCPPAQVCRELPTAGGERRVRLCLPSGVRREGERCSRTPSDSEEACGPQLLCGGAGWCARPCDPQEAAACQEGFFCADTLPTPLCLPTCEARGCPEGQQCIRFEEGVSACAVVHGPSCQRAPCSEGRECFVDYASRRPGVVWTECVHACGPGRSECPEGFACNRWHCQRSCAPEVPGACEAGYRCEQDRPDAPWVCQPDL